jgi:AAA+ superfamily predicted ATPase
MLRGETRAVVAEDTEQIVISVRPQSGEIVNIEKVDKNGTRTELSADECRGIAGTNELDELDAAIEEAFEAGVDAVLGDDDEEDEQAFIKRLIVWQLAGGRVHRRIGALRRNMLRQLVMRRLVRRRVLSNALGGKKS